MKPVWLIVTVVLFFCSCAGTQRATSSRGADGQTSVANERDGSSFEKAVIVKSIREEYEWVAAHYPGSGIKMQRLEFKKKKPYDILTFTMSDGSERDFYFDVSKFYGKF